MPKSSEKSGWGRRDWLILGGGVLLLGVSVAVALALPRWLAEEERGSVGRVRAIRGHVQLRSVESTLWMHAAENQLLASGDVIATEAASSARLEVQGREFVLGEHAQIVVDAPRLGTGMILSVEIVKGELLVTEATASRAAESRAGGVKIRAGNRQLILNAARDAVRVTKQVETATPRIEVLGGNPVTASLASESSVSQIAAAAQQEDEPLPEVGTIAWPKPGARLLRLTAKQSDPLRVEIAVGEASDPAVARLRLESRVGREARVVSVKRVSEGLGIAAVALAGASGSATLTLKGGNASTARSSTAVSWRPASEISRPGTIIEVGRRKGPPRRGFLSEAQPGRLRDPDVIKVLRPEAGPRVVAMLGDEAFAIGRRAAWPVSGAAPFVFLDAGGALVEARLGPGGEGVDAWAAGLRARIVAQSTGRALGAGERVSGDLYALRPDLRVLRLDARTMKWEPGLLRLASRTGVVLFTGDVKVISPTVAGPPRPPSWNFAALEALRAKARGTYPRRVVFAGSGTEGRGPEIQALDADAFSGLGLFEAARPAEVRLALSLNIAPLPATGTAQVVAQVARAARADLVVWREALGRTWSIYAPSGKEWRLKLSRPSPGRRDAKSLHEWLADALGFEAVVIERKGDHILVELPTYRAAQGRLGVLRGDGGVAALLRQVSATAPLAAFRIELGSGGRAGQEILLQR